MIKKAHNTLRINIVDLLTKSLNVISSSSEVRRLVKQNAVKINGNIIDSINYQCVRDKEFLLQIGKKIAFKIIIN